MKESFKEVSGYSSCSGIYNTNIRSHLEFTQILGEIHVFFNNTVQ